MRRHRLDRRAPQADLVTVVREICGVQAQVLGAAYLALWVRVAGVTPAAIDDHLLRTRVLVKTWAMRGTLHLLGAADLILYLRALGRGGWWAHESWLRRRGLSRRSLERGLEAIRRALEGGPLTRKELAEAVRGTLDAATGNLVAHSWGGIVHDACTRGLVCFGPPRGQEVTFVLVDQWLPGAARRAPDVVEAEDEVFRRYLAAFGPASLTDFAYWSGMPVHVAEPILRRLRGELLAVEANGRPGWILRRDAPALQRAPAARSVRLLPNFDTYLLGHRDKSHLVDDVRYKQVYRTGGWISATVLVDGRVAGTWAAPERPGPAVIRVQPFAALPRGARDALRTEARRLGRFLHLPEADLRIE